MVREQGNDVYVIDIESIPAKNRDTELAKSLSLFRDNHPDLRIVSLTPVSRGGLVGRYILLVEPRTVTLEKPDDK